MHLKIILSALYIIVTIAISFCLSSVGLHTGILGSLQTIISLSIGLILLGLKIKWGWLALLYLTSSFLFGAQNSSAAWSFLLETFICITFFIIWQKKEQN